MAVNFQTIYKWLVPSWLSEGEGGLVLASLALIKDSFMQRALGGLEARMPSRAGASALALIGADRGIVRGRSESDAAYARRLIAWRYPRGHRTRGSAFALLSQVGAYWGSLVEESNTVDRRGNAHEREADGVESYNYGSPYDWDGTPIASAWGRFWVILSPAADSGIVAWPDFGDAALWDGQLSVDVCIGLDGCTPDDARAMRRLFTGRAWKPAGTRAEWLIWDLGGLTVPDGTWGPWSKNVAGTQTATRAAGARYWALNDTVNVYAGNAANFPTAYNKPGGGTYAGNPALFAASITLPDGSTYAGNPATFHASMRLPDDGSPAF